MGKKRLEELSRVEQKRVLALLRHEEEVIYKEHYRLYVVSSKTMERLAQMRRRFAKKLHDFGIVAPRKKPYYYVAKLVNPDPKDVAVDYSIVEIKRYIYVKDEESILRNIDKEFEIWKRGELKNARALCKERNEEECGEIMQKTLQRIAQANERKEIIKSNLDRFEVLWTTYRVAKRYPSVAYKRVGQNHYNEHLRKHIPNVLAYDPSLNRHRKRDNEVEAFLEEAKNIFGFFYYKEL